MQAEFCSELAAGKRQQAEEEEEEGLADSREKLEEIQTSDAAEQPFDWQTDSESESCGISFGISGQLNDPGRQLSSQFKDSRRRLSSQLIDGRLLGQAEVLHANHSPAVQVSGKRKRARSEGDQSTVAAAGDTAISQLPAAASQPQLEASALSIDLPQVASSSQPQMAAREAAIHLQSFVSSHPRLEEPQLRAASQPQPSTSSSAIAPPAKTHAPLPTSFHIQTESIDFVPDPMTSATTQGNVTDSQVAVEAILGEGAHNPLHSQQQAEPAVLAARDPQAGQNPQPSQAAVEAILAATPAPAASTSRLPLSETELLQFVPKRSVRARTALQLAPYSLERQKYKTQLLRNGWPDVAKERDRVAMALDRAEARLSENYVPRDPRDLQLPRRRDSRDHPQDEYHPEPAESVIRPEAIELPTGKTNLKRKKKTVHIYSSESESSASSSASSSTPIVIPPSSKVSQTSRKAEKSLPKFKFQTKSSLQRSQSHISISSSASTASSPSSSPTSKSPLRASEHESSGPNRVHISEEGDPQIIDDVILFPDHTRTKPGKKYRLDKTRAKMLGHTMPGLFHKRAEQDLRLLEKENALAQRKRTESKEKKRRKKQVDLNAMLQQVDEGGESDDNVDHYDESPTVKRVERDAIDVMLTSNKSWKTKRRKNEMDGIADWVAWRRKHAGAGKEVDEGWDDDDAMSEEKSASAVETIINKSKNRSFSADSAPTRTKPNKTSVNELFPSVKAFSKGPKQTQRKLAASEKSARVQRKISVAAQSNRQSSYHSHSSEALPPLDRTQVKITNEWSKAGIVSTDFGIVPLLSGIALRDTSEICKGRIWELTHLPSGPSETSKPLNGVVRVDEMESLWDEVFLHLTSWPQSSTSLYLLLRRLCLSASSAELHLDGFAGFDDWQLSALEGLDHTYERLQSHPNVTEVPLEFEWFAVELCFRMDKANGISDEFSQGAYSQALDRLFDRLLQSGIHNVMDHIRDQSQEFLADVALEMWVSLIHLLSQDDREDAFYRTFSPIFQRYLQSQHPGQPLLICEASFYMSFALSQVSQFSQTGVSMSKPSLNNNWTIIIRAISSVNLLSNVEVDAAASAMAITVRDRYIWSIFARCLNLACLWGWSVGTGTDSVLTPLFEILNSRKLLGLKRERSPDFPLFIRKFDVTLADKLDPINDTAVDIFLKLLKRACAGSAGDPKSMSRFLSRISPVRRIPFSVLNPPTTRDISMLFNHYSFELQLLLLLPSSCRQWLAQARNFLAFSAADYRSRQVCIRAMMYFAVLHRHHSLSLKPITSWFADMSNSLVDELAMIAKEERKGIALASSKFSASELEKRGLLDEEYARSLPRRRSEFRIQLLMVLRSIQHVINNCSLDPQRNAERKFPDIELLHDSWIKGILQSHLARDIEIGIEVLTCIQAILSARAAALPVKSIELPSGESQDEFGVMDIDFSDPSLIALLGPTNQTDNETTNIHSQDLKLAQIIKVDVAPAISTLLSNLFVQDPVGAGRKQISDHDKSRYIDTVIDTWASCAHMLVSHEIKAWESYFSPFGAESWRRRFTSRQSRQRVGIRFCNALFTLDPQIYSSIKNYIFDMLMECLVTPIMTVDQSAFCKSILRINFRLERDGSPLLAVIPEYFALRLDGDGEAIEILQLSHRLQLVRAIFQNAEKVLLSEENTSKTQQAKTQAYECTRGALCSMQDVFENLPETDKQDYLVIALAILQILQESIGHRHLSCMKEVAYFQRLNQEVIDEENQALARKAQNNLQTELISLNA